MATGIKSKGAEQNAQGASTFDLGTAELATLTGTRGRKATDSVYLDVVKAALEKAEYKTASVAVENGAVNGISASAGTTVPWIGAQLRKAAKQCNAEKRITVFARDTESLKANPEMLKSHPHGFVAWVVTAE